MSYSHASPLAVHIEAARRLLEALEEQGDIALAALKRIGGDGFAGALDERNHVLNQLGEVVDAIAQEGPLPPLEDSQTEDLRPMLSDVARAAAAALESQQLLTAHAARERNRLVAAIHNTNRFDTVAQRYAVATGGSSKPATLSVSG